MAKADDQRQLTIRLDPELYDRVSRIAGDHDRSMNGQISKLLEAAADRLEKEGDKLAGIGEDQGSYAMSLSGERVPEADLELAYLRDALWVVEEGARAEGVALALEEKAEWIVLVYRIKRMMPTFEAPELTDRVRREMRTRSKPASTGEDKKGETDEQA